MPQYILKGIVHPQRATLSLSRPIKEKVTHLSSKKELCIELNIVVNQITIWIESTEEWNLDDLRNIGRAFTITICSILTFIYGYYYEVEIIQMLYKEKGTDHIFGIDTPCISNRDSIKDFKAKFEDIINITNGKLGIYLQRCFKDLNSALKDTEDTAFYCFRAIESLKQHCKEKFNISENNEVAQWKKLSEICGYDKSYIDIIKNGAKVLRHGGYVGHTEEERIEFLTKTWNVVEGFIKKIM